MDKNMEGRRVRLVFAPDVKTGAMGTVEFVGVTGIIYVAWDNEPRWGTIRRLIPGVDQWEWLP